MLNELGMSVNELGQAHYVIISLKDRSIKILNPNVVELDTPQGKMYQIAGGEQVAETHVEEMEHQSYTPSDEDVAIVAMQAGVTEDEARRALTESNGDLARAILSLKKK